jgi:hypothetical protein
MGETERVMWWSPWISGRAGVAAVCCWCRARRCYWWGREVVVVSGDREWTPDFAIIVAESVVRETPWRGGDWAIRKPVENGGRSTVTVRDGVWYGKEVEDGDLWPWVWFGEEDEGWNGLTLVGISWACYRLCGKGAVWRDAGCCGSLFCEERRMRVEEEGGGCLMN